MVCAYAHLCERDGQSTGFTIGVENRVRASERRTEPIGEQQKDREWVNFIVGINAMGCSIAPYLVFIAKNHDAFWYQDLKPQWRIGISDNYWSTNTIGIDWLKYFIEQIKKKRVRVYVLLIIDGHESHKSLAFQNFCKENNIITLCIPPHSSHILRLLDGGCFALLNWAYNKEIRVLATDHVNRIDKKAFIASFTKIFEPVFSKANIQLSFRASKSDSTHLRGEVWEPDSLRVQSQRRDDVSMVEMTNIACGKTAQSFQVNTSTCTTTGVSLLLLLEHKGTAMSKSKKVLLTRRQFRFARAAALHLNTTPGPACSYIHTDRQSFDLTAT